MWNAAETVNTAAAFGNAANNFANGNGSWGDVMTVATTAIGPAISAFGKMKGWSGCFVAGTAVLEGPAGETVAIAGAGLDMAESSRSQWVLIILSAAAIPVAVVVGLTAQRRAAKHSPPAMPQLRPPRRLRERCFAQWDDAVWVEEEVEESELLMTAASGIAWERAVFGALVAGESKKPLEEKEPLETEHEPCAFQNFDKGTNAAVALAAASTVSANEPWEEPRAEGISPRRAFWTAALSTIVLMFLLIFGVAWFGSDSEASPSAHAAATLTTQQQQWNYRNIEDYRPGMWAMARNPEMQRADQALDEFTSDDRLLRFELRKPDGSLLEFTLVRDLDWLDGNEAEVGKEVDTELEELGVSGPATVIAIEAAPTTTARRHADQRLVTGTFKHHVPGTVKLQIAEQASGQVTELECTPNHPIWCSERQAFVRADELRPGQALESALPGQYRLVSITPRAGPTTVYNLEVDQQHVYYAGGFATLVHNSCQGGVYVIKDKKTGDVVRTGRTNDLIRREKEHKKVYDESKYKFEAKYKTNSYAAQRGLANMLYIQGNNGTKAKFDRIRDIAEDNPSFKQCQRAAKDFLRRLTQ